MSVITSGSFEVAQEDEIILARDFLRALPDECEDERQEVMNARRLIAPAKPAGRRWCVGGGGSVWLSIVASSSQSFK